MAHFDTKFNGQGVGLDYMAQLASRPGIQWNQVALAHDQWSYRTQGLTPAGAALLAIAVAYFTAGSGFNLLGTTTANATGSVTTLGGTTLTTTTAATATTGAITTTYAAGAMVNAGFTTLATTAATNFVNNGGDIGKTLEALGSDSSIRSLVTSMLSAGAVNNLGDAFVIEGTKMNQITLSNSSFTANLTKNPTTGLVTSAIDSVVNDRPLNIGNVLTSSVVTTAAASGANLIGDLATGQNGNAPQISAGTQLVAHAGLGCLVGAATAGNGSGCAPGATGAVVGEVTAQLATTNGASSTQALGLATITSAATGVLVGGGGDNVQAVNIASAAGTNAAQNNYLKHTQWAQLAERLKNCKSEAECTTLRKEFAALSAKQDAELNKACEDISSNACRSQLAEVQAGTLKQKELVIADKSLPDYFLGGSGLNASANLIVKKVIIADIRAACAHDPSCTAKKQEALVKVASLALDFTPIIGDIKGFVEAETPFDYVLATLGTIGGPVGDSLVKVLREGKAAYKAGDVTTAAAKLEEAKTIRNVMDQTAVVPSLSGNISKGKLGKEAIIVPTPPVMGPSIESIRINGDITGAHTENLVNVTLKTDPGMVVLDGIKYGENNGLDHVVQFVDPQTNKLMTMIIDSKQLAKNGSTSLDPRAAGGVMQLSDASLDVVMRNIGDSLPAVQAIRREQNTDTLVKAVAYVDKTTGELKVVPVNVPNPKK